MAHLNQTKYRDPIDQVNAVALFLDWDRLNRAVSHLETVSALRFGYGYAEGSEATMLHALDTFQDVHHGWMRGKLDVPTVALTSAQSIARLVEHDAL